MSIKFVSRVRIRGVNPFVPVRRSQARALRANWRKPMPILLRLAGRGTPVWRTNLMPAGDGRFYLYLHGAMRSATQTGVGDRIHVELRFDPEYRGGPMRPPPAWFRQSLRKAPPAARGWRALPPSRKKEIVRYIARLKTPAARARNLARALRVLSGGRGRFMGREWEGGR